MSHHVIVGAGPVGTATAQLLANQGEQVRLVSRSGRGPVDPAIELIAADATDAEKLTALATGANALYNCANPQYHRWLTDWPPLYSAMLTAVQRNDTLLVNANNAYGYGHVSAPITESTPLGATHPKLRLRGDMWNEALKAHQAGTMRVTEVRASDYIEANSIFSFVLLKPLHANKTAYTPVPLDVLHSWTSIGDVARALVTVAKDERAWGQAWHAPTNAPLTVRQLATKYAELMNLNTPKLAEIPYPILWSMGLFSPMLRELRTTRYQFTEPFILDSTHTESTFGLAPTDMDTALRNIARP
ncbi:MAG: NAD-dependent epimerase [Corynebacteriales bacterium]|nr:NAD-dependent epimerase [Mycobacteriales bacterium]